MFAGEFVKAFYFAFPAVREVKRGQLGDGNFVTVGHGFFVRQREQHRGHTLLRLPDTFHCSQLGGLVFHGVETVRITSQNLQRYQHRSQIDTGLQTGHDLGAALLTQPAVGRDTGHQESDG